MITTERTGDGLSFNGDRLSFNVSGCTAYIQSSQCGVTILACDHLSYDVEPASFEPDEAVAVLRAMLREIAGPSIDDLREVWAVPHDYIDVSEPDTEGDTAEVRVFAVGLDWYYSAPTLREAMQAAYDAGVEMYGADA